MKSDLRQKDWLIGTGQILRWPTTRSEAWTKAFLAGAEREPNMMAIVAVGSSVRPDVASVDLDLIVVCKEPSQLPLKPPIEVDLRAYATGQVDEFIGAGNDILGWAVKFGCPLFQREGYWDAVLEKWQRQLPLPSADLTIRRADEAFLRLTGVLEVGDVEAAQEQVISYLTHVARAELLRSGVYPASRPELADQLRASGRPQLALLLDRELNCSVHPPEAFPQLIEALIAARNSHPRGRVDSSRQTP